MQITAALLTLALALATACVTVSAQDDSDAFAGNIASADDPVGDADFSGFGPQAEALGRRAFYGYSYGYEPEYQYVMRRSSVGGVGPGVGGLGYGGIPSIYSANQKVAANKFNKQKLNYDNLKHKNLDAKQSFFVKA